MRASRRHPKAARGLQRNHPRSELFTLLNICYDKDMNKIEIAVWSVKMTRTVVVVFDGYVLRPEASLDLEPNVKYQVTIEPLENASSGAQSNAWDTLAGLAGSIEAPADWSSEHDHYLYGTPKRHGAQPT